jgi:adenylate cyclase
MTRRSRESGKQAKPRRKAEMPKRAVPPNAVPGRRSTTTTQETETARLTRDRDEAREQQKATAEILRVIRNSPADVQPVFEMIVRSAVSLCGSLYANVFRFDGELLHFVASHNVAPIAAPRASVPTRKNWRHYVDLFKTKYPMRPDLSQAAGRVVLTKSVVRLEDALTDPDYDQRWARTIRFRRLLGVPMLRDGEPLGVIVAGWAEAGPVPKVQEELLKTFADQAVIAIENARLLNELRESLDRQTATANILRVIAGTPEDSKGALDKIAETALRMFDATNVNFRRLEGNVLRMVSSAGPSYAALREVMPDAPLEPTDPAVRSVFENRQIAVEDRHTTLLNEHGEIARALRNLPERSLSFTPLSREGKGIGVMIVSRSEVRPFQEHELVLMSGFADQAVIAIENARLLGELRESYRVVQQQAGKLEGQSQELVKLNQQLERRVADQVGEIERMSRLRRFLPPQVADLIVASGTEKQLESHRREITALFCDLRGFTGFSESSDPEDVMALLRDYHAAIGQIVVKYSGTLERYAGDGVMVVFNDPVPVENPALQAVLMALEMRNAIGALTETWGRWGHDIGFGIGIADGFATLGTIGFEGRFDYAAIGTVSNVASRLCDEAKPGQILINSRVLTKVENAVTVKPVGEFALKGIRRPMMAYNVLKASTSN